MESRKKHIVIVSDDSHIRAGLSICLQAAGYVVTVTSDGMPAQRQLWILKSEGKIPDLILLDVMTPGISGNFLTKSMEDLQMDVPVLIISGFDVRRTMQSLPREMCVYARIEKPFEQDELLARIGDVLDRYARSEMTN